jgi:formamidopyrimidine-DNA glycosylase
MATNYGYNLMSTELLSSPKLDFDLQKGNDEEGEITKNMMIQQEIECPRCYDVMLLSSDFDRLLYFCQECQLSLVMK